ncbi:MAG: thioredoxin family protein [Bacillota bacterium]
MNIKVLGPGCKNCKKLYAMIEEIIKENGLDASLEKVFDYGEIIKYGVMITPAVIIDGKTVFSGRVPSKSDLTQMIAG